MQLSIEIPEDLVLQLQTLENGNEFIRQAILKALEQNRKKDQLKIALNEMRTQAEQQGLSEEQLVELLRD